MPLPGGPADKAGNRYEAWWTVACMAQVLRGKYDSIRLEPPGPDGEGVEFYLQRGAARDFHQVKRGGGRNGSWKLAELNRRGILRAFRDHLVNSDAQCAFVTAEGATELAELHRRAQSAASLVEFEREFLKGEWATTFGSLRTMLQVSHDQCFDFVSRIDVYVLDEVHAERIAMLELETLVGGSARAAANALFTLVFGAVHRELRAVDLLTYLREAGVQFCLSNDPSVQVAVIEAQNNRYSGFIAASLIGETLIERKEAREVCRILLDPGCTERRVFITGGAGFGKSAVVLQVIRALQANNVPFLALRLDRLEPTQLPREIGRQLGLDRSPVAALSAAAGGAPCVLVIDQLDAVSLISGRHPALFDVVSEMVAQARSLGDMKVLLVCRKFDYENDHRFRRLAGSRGDNDAATMIDVEPLPHADLDAVLAQSGVERRTLTEHQRRLLSVPSNLWLFLETRASGATNTFHAAGDLYSAYWARKEQALRERLPHSQPLAPLVDALCAYMSRNQELTAPIAILDSWAHEVRALQSEGLLVRDGQKVTFFHEGFFDYAFARRFSSTGGDLLTLLREGEQHLFRRAQVRQILAALRDQDRAEFRATVGALLAADDVRFHIKQIVFALLAQLPDPEPADWQVVERLLSNPSFSHRDEAWSCLRGPAWFDMLDRGGLVEQWLDGADETVARVLLLMRGVRRTRGDRVATLLMDRVASSDEWRSRARQLVQWGGASESRGMFELLVRLIDLGAFDDACLSYDHNVLAEFYQTATEQPGWTSEAISHWLRRVRHITLAAGRVDPFEFGAGLTNCQGAEQIFRDAAMGAPLDFATQVVPVVIDLILAGPADRAQWHWRMRRDGHTVIDHLLTALDLALCAVAKSDPGRFRTLADGLSAADVHLGTFARLRGYTSNPAEFERECIDCLTASASQSSRSGFSGDPYGVMREAIEALTPVCASASLERLQSALLIFYPELAPNGAGCRYRGKAQYQLLAAIPEARRSGAVNARIGEWFRKFGPLEQKRRRAPEMQVVGSPIPAAAAERMSDEHWLRAIATYHDDRSHTGRDGTILGGAFELSHLLKLRATAEPERFARLALRLGARTNGAYFAAVLEALGASELESQLLFDVCRHVHGFPARANGRELCRLVEKHPDLPWPDDLLGAVEWYATEHPDPEREGWREGYYDGDPHGDGINTVRGAAAGALSALLFADRAKMPRLARTISRMVSDSSIAVRSCVATTLLAVWTHSPDEAVDQFVRLCRCDEAFLATRTVEDFIAYAVRSHLEALAPIIERMLRSTDSKVAVAGARRACLALFDHARAESWADDCMGGDDALRRGAAEIFAANAAVPECRNACARRLPLLFDDPSDDVRAAAAHCWRRFHNDDLAHSLPLVDAFCRSAAFEKHAEPLLRAFEGCTARLPSAVLGVCRTYLVRRPDRHHAYGAKVVADLLVRAYHQVEEAGETSTCLDLIDQALAANAWGMDEALETFDR